MTESSAGDTHGDPGPPDLMDAPPSQMVTTAALGDSPAVDPQVTIEAMIESLEPLLLEIRSDVDANRNKSESTAVALEQMTGDLAEMRAQMAGMSRTIVKSSKGFADVCVEMRRVRTAAIAARPGETRASHRAHASFGVGAALILISWALLLYFKTGLPWPALAILVGANLTGWLVIMIARVRA